MGVGPMAAVSVATGGIDVCTLVGEGGGLAVTGAAVGGAGGVVGVSVADGAGVREGANSSGDGWGLHAASPSNIKRPAATNRRPAIL